VISLSDSDSVVPTTEFGPNPMRQPTVPELPPSEAPPRTKVSQPSPGDESNKVVLS
jgi:hypothetical protein